MIHVIAILSAKPNQQHALLDAFASIVPAVLAENGCIEYSVTVDTPDANPAFGVGTVIVIEKWDSRAVLKAHAASSHMAAFSARTKDLCDSVAVHVLQSV